MRCSPEIHDALAALLGWPDEGYPARAAAAGLCIAEACPEAAQPLEAFLAHVSAARLGELQEQYARTFEVDPQCCLEVGWHLFGENYKRGEFLVQMRRLLRELELPENAELPDHLTQLLRAAGRMDPESAGILARRRILPAVERMAIGLSANENPFEGVLDAVQAVLARGVAAQEAA